MGAFFVASFVFAGSECLAKRPSRAGWSRARVGMMMPQGWAVKRAVCLCRGHAQAECLCLASLPWPWEGPEAAGTSNGPWVTFGIWAAGA